MALLIVADETVTPVVERRKGVGSGLTETWDTLEILAEEGIEYVSDWVTDDQPRAIKTASRPLAMVPYTLEMNDIPMMLVQHHAAHELLDRARDQFDRLYDEGRRSARIMATVVHPYG